MALLARRYALLAVAVSLGCVPFDVELFPASEVAQPDGSGGAGAAPVVVGLVGGTTGLMGGAGGGEPSEFLVDDFEDGDSRAFEPAGWWYTVNDGTGVQVLSVVDASVEPERGLVLEVSAAGFTDWGAAFGLDVAAYDFPSAALEVSFFASANREVQVSLHALDASGDHFTTDFLVTTSWKEVTIRLDRLFIVDEVGVRSLDVTTIDELQWFVFDVESTVVRLDDVVLRSY